MARTHLTEFGQFWRQTCDKVRAYMFCASNNASDADDLAQECYLRAFRNWDRFDGRGNRQAWLFAIARNTQADWFRKRGRDARLLERERLDAVAEIPAPEIESADAVWQAIGKLTGEHREIVHLRFAADLSYAEIAQMLGVPVGTVRSRLHRALKAIREQIKEYDNGT
jgi:RNA polymerase sigma-70 factor (ECF subfamily)